MAPVAVIGSGLIGRSWAIVFARAGHAVRLWDGAPGVAAAALARIEAALVDLREVGLLDDPVEVTQARITVALSLAEALKGAELAQESAPESVAVKRSVFADLDAAAAPATILASSTSSIPASRFTESLAGRGRCLVAHPVNPPHLVPLVELVPAPWTDLAVVERARGFYDAVGQVPITVRGEIHGFILNRLQGAVLAEAFRLVADGYVGAEDLDRTMRDGLGLRWSFMGPFETIDLNAPGGIIDYVARYAGLYEEIGASQLPRPWDTEAVRRIELERREQLSATELGARAGWRDRRLARLVAHKREAATADDAASGGAAPAHQRETAAADHAASGGAAPADEGSLADA